MSAENAKGPEANEENTIDVGYGTLRKTPEGEWRYQPRPTHGGQAPEVPVRLAAAGLPEAAAASVRDAINAALMSAGERVRVISASENPRHRLG